MPMTIVSRKPPERHGEKPPEDVDLDRIEEVPVKDAEE
jgi:hypothetical protein